MEFLPKSEYLERFDGSVWKRFELGDGGNVVITSRGQELLSYNKLLISDLRTYRREAIAGVTSGAVRRWFRAGGNSDVYSIGRRPLVMKEASTAYSAWLALDRMDYLQGICARELPTHIRVPDHYGLMFSRSLPRQYLLMQKVNDGLTVEDVMSGKGPREHSQLVLDQFGGLKERVQEAIDISPISKIVDRDLLPDWSTGNVVVDFYTRTPDMPFTFWIIDQ